jgi:phosphatidylglycerophosphatase A
VAAQTGRKDPQIIVIDEVLGQWLTLTGAMRFDFWTFVLAFGLFRLFDIWKPPPIRLIEQVPGGAGIVLDDMAAGAYAALVLFLAGWFNHH